MDANVVLALGLGMRPPWRLVGQRLDPGKQPHELHLDVCAERGSLFPCPVCGNACKAHDFAEFTWRHLNFFQHHCYITAKVPRNWANLRDSVTDNLRVISPNDFRVMA